MAQIDLIMHVKECHRTSSLIKRLLDQLDSPQCQRAEQESHVTVSVKVRLPKMIVALWRALLAACAKVRSKWALRRKLICPSIDPQEVRDGEPGDILCCIAAMALYTFGTRVL
jgi:hypothetical protein